MKVYILMREEAGGTVILGVFTTLEKAKTAACRDIGRIIVTWNRIGQEWLGGKGGSASYTVREEELR